MKRILVLLLIVIPITLAAQQLPDTSFIPVFKDPAFKQGKGPLVLIDEAHNNFHTMGNRYLPFATVLRRDGFRVAPNKTAFTNKSLKKADILVIANAVHKKNAHPKKWYLPTPSAFTKNEIKEVKNWVKNGGSLFLIAEHMPMSGAAEKLAAEFGFKMLNGFAFNDKKQSVILFRRSDGTLTSNVITNGKGKYDRIDSVATFTGCAFEAPKKAISILNFPKGISSLMADTSWIFNDSTKKIDATGLSQGAVVRFGKGRVAVFGEAAMFTAQVSGRNMRPLGMNSRFAGENLKFLRNVMQWLAK